jgi:hypothetical protein
MIWARSQKCGDRRDAEVVRKEKTFRVPPGSELARIITRADDGPIFLDADGARYKVSRETDDVWQAYDPEAARAGMHGAAGHLSEEEAEKLKEYLYRGRELGTRPPDRP